MTDELIIESMFNCVSKYSSREGNYEMWITSSGAVIVCDYQGNEKYTYPSRSEAEKEWVIF